MTKRNALYMLPCFDFPQAEHIRRKHIIEAIYPTSLWGDTWKRLIGSYYIVDNDGCMIHLELQETKRLVVDNHGPHIYPPEELDK